VRIGGDQLDPGQAAGDQVAEEPQPAGAVLAAGDVQAEDLPVSVGVDTGGHQGVHADDPAALADLEHQRVSGHEGERTGVDQRAGAELLHVRVEILRHLRDLGLGQRGDPQALDQLVHPARADSQQVAGRHHRGERPLGPLASLEQPLREVRPLAELGDLQVQGAGPGVEVTGPVAVAPVGSIRAGLPVGGAADRVGLSRHQGVDERGQQLAQQIRARLGQLFLEQTSGVDTGGDGHRGVLLRVGFRRSLEGSPGGRRLRR
jgi:hypothetical protein